MAVPWPKVCAILAHELRAPLGVLQGYIRLLERQRPPADPEHATLQAMLEATGRITAIARQASDLGAWLDSLDAAPLLTVQYGDLFAALEGRAPTHQRVTVASPSEALARQPLRADVFRLADALLATAESLCHEAGEDAIEIGEGDGDGAPHGAITLRMAPPSGTSAPVPAGFEAGAERAASFDRGGSGLALISAASVLEVHRAHVTPGDGRSTLLVNLPGDGDPA